jgi:predicted TIM-barrel fold metal-dependent hydrolase
MEIIDTHVHFWDLHHPTITYPWLAPGALHPILGDVEAIKSLRYDPSSYWAECRFSGVTKAVHVEAAARAEDPLAEVKWVLDLPPREHLSLVIVADAVLDAPDVEAQVDALASIAEVRGVRDFELADYFRSPERHRACERGVARLQQSGRGGSPRSTVTFESSSSTSAIRTGGTTATSPTGVPPSSTSPPQGTCTASSPGSA